MLPKDHVEEGESDREAAVREVHEEAGVWAQIADGLRDVSFLVNGSVVTVRFFLMRAVGKGLRKDKAREHLWLKPWQKPAMSKLANCFRRQNITGGEHGKYR